MQNPTHSADRLQRRRGIVTLGRAIADGRQYRAVFEAFKNNRRPLDFLYRYATGRGSYPVPIPIRTPTGDISPVMHSWHDTRTIHEIFLAHDYCVDNGRKTIVDFGSNIGISASYFLSRNSGNYIYLFEPVPRNVESLKKNLTSFCGRYTLNEVAVGVGSGKVLFGVEETGRYGGIGLGTGNSITVDCVDSNEALQEIISKHGTIDVLKIDVETMEQAIVEHLTPALAAKIRLLLVEFRFQTNPLETTHRMSVNRTVSRFELRV